MTECAQQKLTPVQHISPVAVLHDLQQRASNNSHLLLSEETPAEPPAKVMSACTHRPRATWMTTLGTFPVSNLLSAQHAPRDNQIKQLPSCAQLLCKQKGKRVN